MFTVKRVLYQTQMRSCWNTWQIISLVFSDPAIFLFLSYTLLFLNLHSVSAKLVEFLFAEWSLALPGTPFLRFSSLAKNSPFFKASIFWLPWHSVRMLYVQSSAPCTSHVNYLVCFLCLPNQCSASWGSRCRNPSSGFIFPTMLSTLYTGT